jgi:PEP-CTERM motif-containing protein
LSTTLFTLADGTHFQADSNTITTLLTPSSGSDLIPGVDFAPITISGSIVTVQVPEPPTWWLLLGMISLVVLLRRGLFRRV